MSDDGRLEVELAALEAMIADESFQSAEPVEVARALERRARLLGRLHRFADADDAFAAAISQFGGELDPGVERVVVRARFNRALYRSRNSALADALVTVDELLTCHAADPPHASVDVIVSGFALRAKLLWQLDRKDEANALYGSTFERYRDEEDRVVQRDLARMLLEKAHLEEQDAQFEVELQTLDELITVFAESEDPRLQKAVSRALFRRAVALGRADRPEEAVVLWGSLWERSKDDSDAPTEAFAISVLHNEALLLGQLDRREEAREALEELFVRYVDNTSASIAAIVADAVDLRLQHIVQRKNQPTRNVQDCDRLLAQISGAGAVSVQLAAGRVMHLKCWELLDDRRIDEAVAVAKHLTQLFVDEQDSSLVKPRGDLVLSAARILCFHPRLARAMQRPGTRIALSVGDHLAQPTREKLRGALPCSFDRAALAVACCRQCHDQAAAMFMTVVNRSAPADDIRLQELAAHAREAWSAALKLRLHPVQMTRVTGDLVEQGEAAARMLRGLAERDDQPAWRAAMLSFNAILTGAPADSAEQARRLRSFVARYADNRSPLARLLVLLVRMTLAYESTKTRVSKAARGTAAG